MGIECVCRVRRGASDAVHSVVVTGRARGARTVVGKKTAPDDRDPTD